MTSKLPGGGQRTVKLQDRASVDERQRYRPGTHNGRWIPSFAALI